MKENEKLLNLINFQTKKGATKWHLDKMGTDLADSRGRCIKQRALTAIKNVPSRLNPAVSVPYIARTATQKEKIAVVKDISHVSLYLSCIIHYSAILPPEETKKRGQVY